MIKIDTSDNTLSITDSMDLSTAVTDTLYCYDNTTMNTINYPTGNVTGANNIFITSNTGTISPNWGITDTLTLGRTHTSPLKVYGDAEIEGNLKLGGKNINEMLDKIEERLAILHPNPELEDRWEELKELGRRYKELERDIIEKEKIYNILKK